MIEVLRSWMFGLIGASILSGLAIGITPKGRTRGVVQMICGIVMIIALIKPIIGFDFDTYSMGLSQYRDKVSDLNFLAQETSDRLQRTIIEEECSAYILDKAHVLGLDSALVAVTAKWGDEGCWYPYEVHLQINGTAEKQKSLARAIEAELGIPSERQYWSNDEN